MANENNTEHLPAPSSSWSIVLVQPQYCKFSHNFNFVKVTSGCNWY